MSAPQIVLVEDNVADVELVLEAFEVASPGVRIHVIRDGGEAMDYFGRITSDADAPRVVLLDLNLPRISGGELLARITGDAGSRRIPVVVLTSSTTPADIHLAYENGCNAYVAKPLDFSGYVAFARATADFWIGHCVGPLQGSP